MDSVSSGAYRSVKASKLPTRYVDRRMKDHIHSSLESIAFFLHMLYGSDG